jgi:hypothetical protein
MIEDILVTLIAPILFVFTLVALVGVGLLALQSNTYKYNCNLEYGPSLKTTLLISDGDFAYDPEGFCSRLKAKMEEE